MRTRIDQSVAGMFDGGGPLAPVRVRELRGRPVVRCPLRRSLTIGLVAMLATFVPVLTFLGLGLSKIYHGSIPIVVGMLALGMAIAAFGVYALTSMGYNHGIQLFDEGIVVFGMMLSPSKTRPWPFRWTDLDHPRLVGSKDVMFRVNERLVGMPIEQARSILLDRRYPFRDNIPDELKRKLGA
jgi:hypothetical protein